MEPAKCPEWFWKTAEELRGLDLFLPLVNLFKQTSGLGDIISGSAPLIRLRREERRGVPHTDVVSIKWDVEEMRRSANEPRYYALDKDILALGRGADLVLEAGEIADYEYPLEILVVDPDDNGKTVAWPLGDGTGVVPPPSSHGRESWHSVSTKLRNIIPVQEPM